MKIVRLQETASTNTYAASLASEGEPLIVVAGRQTAGRGQRGNKWESEPGKNLTLSLLWFPVGFRASLQFAISEAVALAVCDLLRDAGIAASVKWPNDIYVGDRKICGILIEHAVAGTDICHTIAGIGINVNQRRFLSDAPNPVSMQQLLGRESDLEILLAELSEKLECRLASVGSESGRQALHAEFMSRMWRNDGKAHLFRDAATGLEFRGIIRDVGPSGHLSVQDVAAGRLTRYAFKEVEFLLRE